MSVWRPNTFSTQANRQNQDWGFPSGEATKTLILLGNKSRGGRFIFQTCMTDFFTGSWHAPDKVRLEKRVPLFRISLGDLPICPFGGQKPFSTQPNRQIQDWGFSKILAFQEPVVCAEDKPAVSAEEKPVEFAEKKPVVSAEDKPVVSADKKSAVCQDIPQTL